MKLATSTGDLVYLCNSPAEAVRGFEGTGFKHLDYTFWRQGWGDKPILKDDWFKPVEAAAKEAEKLGFDFVQAHSPGCNPFEDGCFDEVVLMNERAIEACGFLGIKKIVIHAGRPEGCTYPDGKERYFEANKRFYEALYPAMQKYGVRVMVENIFGIGEKFGYVLAKGSELAEFIDYCGLPLLGACWDTGHGNIMNKSVYDELIALGGRLDGLHVQDNFGKWDNHLVPYTGTLDLDGLMNGLIDSGYLARGNYFTFECDNIINADAACRESRNRDSRFEQKANTLTFELKRSAVTFMYEVGKAILSAYDCFEE